MTLDSGIPAGMRVFPQHALFPPQTVANDSTQARKSVKLIKPYEPCAIATEAATRLGKGRSQALRLFATRPRHQNIYQREVCHVR